MESKASKPAFHSVVDLGLRDVGVKNDPRRFAAVFGGMSARVVGLVIVAAFATCVFVALTGAGAWAAFAFTLAWMAAALWLALRGLKRAPVVVVKVNAEGTNQATWLLISHVLLLAPAVLLAGKLVLMPFAVLTVIVALLVWRGRGRVPEMLRSLALLLEAGESVLGDGLGVARGARPRSEAPRLIVATDRRLLVATSSRSTERFLVLDVAYPDVSRFGIEWQYMGRAGVLSLTVAGVDGAPSAHVISSLAPANLLSIALALQSHGVHPDDPAAVAEAERAWEAMLHQSESPQRLLDRAAMSTREFDRGLWLLLGLSAAALYAPVGLGLWVLLVIGALCAISGYVSGTRSSLGYIVPLNLLATPAFFFADADGVVILMFLMSLVAAIGLWGGSALRGATTGRENAPARGSLRYAISGMSLIRISGVLLALMLALVATAAAAGFELTSLRLAVDEATAKQLPVDGRSNLTGYAASITYTPGPGLHELVTDEHFDAGPNDGARWELRSSFTKGYNVVSLAHYVFEPRLDNEAAVAKFVADKDHEHSEGAGFPVSHTKRVVDGRQGYVWKYGRPGRYWYYGAWFPQPVHSVRLECVARGQMRRFKRLCAEAIASLRFH